MKINAWLLWGVIILAGGGLIGLDLYQSQASQSSATAPAASTKPAAPHKSSHSGKTLVVFFSRAGQNYPNTTLKVGYTHQVANLIATQTNGTKYEILPAKPYPNNFQATVRRSQRELTNNARPKIKNSLPNLKRYDTVFIGYPIWNGELPMILRTFMDNQNLNGKTVIPFSTNAGSGWADTLSTLKQTYPRATFRRGLQLPGEQVPTSHAKIRAWLTRLGY